MQLLQCEAQSAGMTTRFKLDSSNRLVERHVIRQMFNGHAGVKYRWEHPVASRPLAPIRWPTYR